jgi:DnaJ-class molecular chaperone
MSYKVNGDGIVCMKQSASSKGQEQECIHCDGAGIVNNRLCKTCNGHGVVFCMNDHNCFRVMEYAPTKEQLAAMETLGGVA